jgi:hypothetical protein
MLSVVFVGKGPVRAGLTLRLGVLELPRRDVAAGGTARTPGVPEVDPRGRREVHGQPEAIRGGVKSQVMV